MSASFDNGSLGVWFMNNGAVSGAAGRGAIDQGDWSFEALADFNGDGRDDVLMRDHAGNLGMWLMNGAAATGVALANVDASFAVAAIGDYNGDGRGDIL